MTDHLTVPGGCAMAVEWDLRESGPTDATHTVLLLPGAMTTAEFYAELMVEPRLADVRLVAATLPGHGGTEPPEDLGVEHCAQLAAELAADLNCDLVVGYSMGANVTLEMAASGAFTGPIVLLGASFSLADEAMVLRVADWASRVLGHLPFSLMLAVLPSVLKASRLSARRQFELLVEFKRNDPRVLSGLIRCYLHYLRRNGSVAARLCETGVPAWVVHAETGDGGLTAAERRTLEACETTSVVTIPGTSWLLPNEEPARTAEVVTQALARLRRVHENISST
jgi:pimeloyl-ACP methyl ester carboxylesterase